TVATKGERCHLGPERILPTLPFGSVDEAQHGVDNGRVVSAGEELLAALRMLDVRIKDLVEEIVGRQGILVSLSGPQFRARDLVDRVDGNRGCLATTFGLRVSPAGQIPHPGLVEVLER